MIREYWITTLRQVHCWTIGELTIWPLIKLMYKNKEKNVLNCFKLEEENNRKHVFSSAIR